MSVADFLLDCFGIRIVHIKHRRIIMWRLIKHYESLLWEQLTVKPCDPNWHKQYKFADEKDEEE